MKIPREQREEDAQRADEREDPNPRETLKADDAVARADEPCLHTALCDREQCARWRPCVACRCHGDIEWLKDAVERYESGDGFPGVTGGVRQKIKTS